MARQRTSVIWKVSIPFFENVCKESKTMSEALSHFGLKNKGNNFRTFKARVLAAGLNISHFLDRGQSSAYHRRKPLEEILIRDSTYTNRRSLKKRLLECGKLIYKCYEAGCAIKLEWNGKPIALQLDHINGISNDNRMKNLRLLCPNCHSQTSTFAGKNNLAL